MLGFRGFKSLAASLRVYRSDILKYCILVAIALLGIRMCRIIR